MLDNKEIRFMHDTIRFMNDEVLTIKLELSKQVIDLMEEYTKEGSLSLNSNYELAIKEYLYDYQPKD